MYFFTADEHYGHENIIKLCRRPFDNVYEMDLAIITRHNELIKEDDIVIHAGDFAYKNRYSINTYINKLNGTHIFLKGSHDKSFKDAPYIWEGIIENQCIVVCHYPMRSWPRSHYGSWQLHGHSHGKLEPLNNQYDIGVDNNNFYPVSFDSLVKKKVPLFCILPTFKSRFELQTIIHKHIPVI